MMRMIFLFLLVIPLAACDRAISVERNPDGSTDITVTLTESDINSVIQQALNEGGNPLLRDPEVDLQNGQIVVSGEHDRQDGGGRVSGTMTLVMSVSDGRLSVRATAINIEGLDANDQTLQEFNDRLAEAMGQRASRDNRNARLMDVTITQDNLSFTLNVQRSE